MKKLVISRYNKIIGGVCGGIAEYLNIDPFIVRLISIIFAIFGFGITVLIYIMLWIIIPEN